MTGSEWIRVLVFAAGMVAIIGSLGEMWYGPRRGMMWSQFLRYSSLVIVLGTIMVVQYARRSVPITGYTISFAVGAVVGSLGVAPALRKPMIAKPPAQQVPDGESTAT